MRTLKLALGLCVISLGAATAAHAQSEKTVISSHGVWTAYEYSEGGQKVCYLASQPTKDEGDYSNRGSIFAMITHRPGQGVENEFSYVAGYPYKSGSEVTVTIDGQTFTLFTQDDMAWTTDAETDTRLAEAIQSGSTMTVKGTSQRGTMTTDTFSLNGSAAAYDAAANACGM